MSFQEFLNCINNGLKRNIKSRRLKLNVTIKEFDKLTKKYFANLNKEDDSFDFIDLDLFSPNKPLTLLAKHSDGSTDEIICNHTYNEIQINWFKAGSALNLISSNNN